ncbi:MAG: 3-deoxy-8-phosphooctulonate synthase [Bacteroidota bacterium]|nr:3-deoxy-8-phosphooctulonate synthase [Bacteroidota bacterium]
MINKETELYNKLTQNSTFFLLAGPCVIEDEQTPFAIAQELKEITQRLQIPFVFKASYRKANRSRLDSFTGIGDKRAIEVLSEIKRHLNLPIITDIHECCEVDMVSQVADILQIPAFLCRQTDLLVCAAKSQKIVNIKKGQFLSPESMRFTLDKVLQSNNEKVMLTDRGTFFGYQDLVVDIRSIPIMKSLNCPVVMDVTHSLQKPNQTAGVSGGDPQMIETIARAAISVGADGIFMETHPAPEQAKSDGKNMLQLSEVEPLLNKLKQLKALVNTF